MKRDHKRAFGLVFWVLTGETKFEDKKWSKKGSEAREKILEPFPRNSSDSHAILSPFQVFIKSMKCPRSTPK